jgi:hypothetical protein
MRLTAVGNLPVSPEYRKYIINGAKLLDLPDSYVKHLDSTLMCVVIDSSMHYTWEESVARLSTTNIHLRSFPKSVALEGLCWISPVTNLVLPALVKCIYCGADAMKIKWERKEDYGIAPKPSCSKCADNGTTLSVNS